MNRIPPPPSPLRSSESPNERSGRPKRQSAAPGIVDLLGAVSVLATVAGFAFAGWSSFAHPRPQRLAYSITGSCPIGPAENANGEASPGGDSSSSVTYQGQNVAHLTATTLCIVNLGTAAIHPTDFASGTPLHFDFGDKVRILNASVVRHRGQARPAVKVETDGRVVNLSAPSLNSGDRIAVIVLSDSRPSDAAEPAVTAELTDGEQIEQIEPLALIHPAYLTLRCAAAACLALPCLIPLFGGWLRSRRLIALVGRGGRDHAYTVLLGSVLATMALAAVDVWAWRWLDQIAALLDGLSRLYAS